MLSDDLPVVTYQPCIDDLAHIRALDRQRFVVLRPGPAVSEGHRRIQEILKERLSALPISYPACAHVTLSGFDAGTPLDAVQTLVEKWACGVPALRIEAECVAVFPPPFQIVFVQIRKTPELLAALVGLREQAEERRLSIATLIPPQDWVFHMSVAYCSELSASAWSDVTALVQTLDVRPGRCLVEQVEVVAVDELVEYSGGVYSLRGQKTSDSTLD
jgi:2'-5' RNA ligase